MLKIYATNICECINMDFIIELRINFATVTVSEFPPKSYGVLIQKFVINIKKYEFMFFYA